MTLRKQRRFTDRSIMVVIPGNFALFLKGRQINKYKKYNPVQHADGRWCLSLREIYDSRNMRVREWFREFLPNAERIKFEDFTPMEIEPINTN